MLEEFEKQPESVNDYILVVKKLQEELRVRMQNTKESETELKQLLTRDAQTLEDFLEILDEQRIPDHINLDLKRIRDNYIPKKQEEKSTIPTKQEGVLGHKSHLSDDPELNLVLSTIDKKTEKENEEINIETNFTPARRSVRTRILVGLGILFLALVFAGLFVIPGTGPFLVGGVLAAAKAMGLVTTAVVTSTASNIVGGIVAGVLGLPILAITAVAAVRANRANKRQYEDITITIEGPKNDEQENDELTSDNTSTENMKKVFGTNPNLQQQGIDQNLQQQGIVPKQEQQGIDQNLQQQGIVPKQEQQGIDQNPQREQNPNSMFTKTDNNPLPVKTSSIPENNLNTNK